MAKTDKASPATLRLASVLTAAIEHAFAAHTVHANRPKDTVRLFDSTTPYAVHPVWCAMTIMQEPLLPLATRALGAQVLLWHDVDEDTTAGLPKGTPRRVRQLVVGMTFVNTEDEWKNLWEREMLVILLKLYDKVNNWLDGTWMTPERKKQHGKHLRRLIKAVEKEYGELNIVRIARALVRT